MDLTKGYLETTSERFRETYSALAQVVRRVFPNAERVFDIYEKTEDAVKALGIGVGSGV